MRKSRSAIQNKPRRRSQIKPRRTKITHGLQGWVGEDGKWKWIKVRQYKSIREAVEAGEPLSAGAKRYIAQLKKRGEY